MKIETNEYRIVESFSSDGIKIFIPEKKVIERTWFLGWSEYYEWVQLNKYPNRNWCFSNLKDAKIFIERYKENWLETDIIHEV